MEVIFIIVIISFIYRLFKPRKRRSQIIMEKIKKMGEGACLAHWNNRRTAEPFHVIEDLYRAPDGKYYIEAQGGSATVYAVPGDSGNTLWKKTYSVSKREAKRWIRDRKQYPQFVFLVSEDDL
jgi:hypothetical protein